MAVVGFSVAFVVVVVVVWSVVATFSVVGTEVVGSSTWTDTLFGLTEIYIQNWCCQNEESVSQLVIFYFGWFSSVHKLH